MGRGTAAQESGEMRCGKAAERTAERGESLRGTFCYGRIAETLLDRKRVGFDPGQVNDLTRAVDVRPDEVTFRIEVHDHARGHLARVHTALFRELQVERITAGVVMNPHPRTVPSAWLPP